MTEKGVHMVNSQSEDNKNNITVANTSGNKKNRTNWKEVIEEVKSSLLWFKQLGVIPTLRTMFYRLTSMEIIPNTRICSEKESKMVYE